MMLTFQLVSLCLLAQNSGSNQAVDLSGPASGPTSHEQNEAQVIPGRQGPKHENPGKRETAGPGASSWYRNPVFSLTLVLGLIAVIATILKRSLRRAGVATGSSIRVLSRTPLGVKQSLALVQVGQRVVLLGLTGERISALCQMDDAEEVARLRAGCMAGAEGRDGTFVRALSGETARYTAGDGDASSREKQSRLSALVDRFKTRAVTMESL